MIGMARILVIDDCDVIRNLLHDFFTERGFDVDVAPTAPQGEEMANAGEYDAVICDTHLAGHSGTELVARLSQRKPSLPIIMTNSMAQNSSKHAESAGALACLHKPFELDQMGELVQSVLQKNIQHERNNS